MSVIDLSDNVDVVALHVEQRHVTCISMRACITPMTSQVEFVCVIA
jgi:hypothetical protein